MSFFKNTSFLVIFLTIIGAVLHFYNLNWGAPWYFHPDERNIATAVSQLQFPNQMNPHFFAYGSLPLYIIYATGVFAHLVSFSHSQLPLQVVPFADAILISRMYSALFATLLIPLMYLLGKRLRDQQTGLFTAILTTFSTGFIQFAHFGTFELWLTLFGICLFWHCLTLVKRDTFRTIGVTGLIFGLLVGIKVSSIVLLPLPILAMLLQQKRLYSGHLEMKKRLRTLSSVCLRLLMLLFVALLTYFITNPYVLLDQKDFIASITYESSVGLGTLPVFYTGGFFDTTPVVYQFLHVYPFLLNPIITILLILCFFHLSAKTIQTKNPQLLLLGAFFLLLFASQAVLFVKWTRYMVPTLPFIYLIIALSLNNITPKSLNKSIWKSTAVGIIIICLLFSFSYFKTAFVSPDTRLAALTYAKLRIPPNAAILSEPYDLGIMPFQTFFPNNTWFNYYDLDTYSPDATPANLNAKLASAEYIIVPSQRILQPRILNAHRFPNAHAFYEELLDGKLGFQKIYETPCDLWCQVTYLGNPVYKWEQTVNVFDRPEVFIFKKYSTIDTK